MVGDCKIDSKWNVKQHRGFKSTADTDARKYDFIVPSKNEYTFSMQYIPVKRLTSPKYDFRHFLGFWMNASSSTAAGGAWTYATNCTTSLSGFTLYKQTSNINTQLNGCVGSRLQVKTSIDNPVEIMAEGMGTLASYASLNRTAASSLTNGVPFYWSDCQVYINGSLSTNVTAFEFTINNNGTSEHTLGNRDPRVVYPTGRDVELHLTRFFNDTGTYAGSKAGNQDAVTISMTDSALGGTAYFLFRTCVSDDFQNPSDIEKLLTYETIYHVKSFSLA